MTLVASCPSDEDEAPLLLESGLASVSHRHGATSPRASYNARHAAARAPERGALLAKDPPSLRCKLSIGCAFAVTVVLLIAHGRQEANDRPRAFIVPWEPDGPTLVSNDDIKELPRSPTCSGAPPTGEVRCAPRALSSVGTGSSSRARVLQALMPCWAFFARHPEKRATIELRGSTSIEVDGWARELLSAAHADVLTLGSADGGASRSESCALRAEYTAEATSGWPVRGASAGEAPPPRVKPGPVRYARGTADVDALVRKLVGPEGADAVGPSPPGAKGAAEIINIGLIDYAELPQIGARPGALGALVRHSLRSARRGSLSEAAAGGGIASDVALPQVVTSSPDLSTLSAAWQARWVRNQTMLFAVHGASPEALLFAAPCTPVVEVFRYFGYRPGLHLPLVQAAGALPYVAYAGAEPEERAWQRVRGIGEEGADTPPFGGVAPTGAELAAHVPRALRAREECLRARARAQKKGPA